MDSNFVKNEVCFRVASYKSCDQDIKSVNLGHDCCSHCAIECCDKRCDEKLPFEKSESLACNSSPVLTRVVSDSDKQDLKEALAELVAGGSHNAFGAVSCHAFSSELVNDVISNSHRLFTIKDVFEYLPVYSIDHRF